MKKQIPLALGLLGLIVVIIINSQKAKAGAQAGWWLCENVIIPSLLPILILTSIIISSNCSAVLEKTIGRIIGRLFNVSPAAAVAILLGLISGYPAGAVLTDKLYNDGRLDKATACRIMKYNFSGGIAFTIMVVGGVCYGNSGIGALLYLCNIISSVIMGALLGVSSKKNCAESGHSVRLSLTDAMTESVSSSIKSILSMCAYIILFSAFNGIFALPDYINPLIEITNGICGASHRLPLDYCAFFLAFGGFCIHFQLIGIISDFGMKYFEFLISRLAGALISFFTARLFTLAFPQYTDVFSAGAMPVSMELTQVNAGLSVIMVLGCAVLVLDIENRKLIK